MKFWHKYLKYMLAVAMPLTFAACDPTEAVDEMETDSMVGYIPVQSDKDGYWGMMSVDGIMLFESEFNNEPSLCINGIFSVKENEGYSLYTVDQQPKLLGDCEDLALAGYCNDGLIPVVRKNARISVVDKAGETRFQLDPVNGREIVACNPAYYEGLLVVTDEAGLNGCFDTGGKCVIAPKYTFLSNFNEGYAIAQLKTGNYVIIDTKGEQVFKLKTGFTIKSHYVKNHEFVISDSRGKLSFMNLKGEVKKLPSKVQAIGDYTNRLFAFADAQGNWGVMSREKDEVLIRPKFKSLTVLARGRQFLVNLADSWSIIDIKGKKVVGYADTYDSIISTDFPGLIKYLAKDDAGWMLLNERGSVINTDFDIYNVGLQTHQEAETLEASLFNPGDFVNEIAALITPNSMAGIYLNAIANKAYDDQPAEDYEEKNEFAPTQMPQAGTGYTISVVGVTDKIIAQRRGEQYQYIPNNVVNAIELIITTNSKDVLNKTREAFIEVIKEKGFKLVDQFDEAVAFRSIYANLEISQGDDPNELSVLMYRL